MALPTLPSTANCAFNGQALKLELGPVGYDGQPALFSTDSCALEVGVVYGLVGPNGVGKSTFARMLASKTLPGFPGQLSTCYLEPNDPRSHNELKPSAYLRRGVMERCQELADQIAELEGALEEDEDEDEEETKSLTEEDLAGTAARLGALIEQEEELQAAGESEIHNVLCELGFDTAGLLDTPVDALSCGWRYKCELANALLSHADLLVLDEPSFLDEASRDWLVERVRRVADAGAIVILISHKEQLQAALADRILFVSASKVLETYNCGYTAFVAAREKNVTHAVKEVTKGEARQANAKSSLHTIKKRLAKSEANNNRKIAQGEDRRWIKGKNIECKQNAGRSAAAKIKQLQRDVDRLEELAKASAKHRVDPIALQGSESPASRQIVSFQDLAFGYRPETPILTDLSLAIYGGDRIALTGANGQGKSTLIKLIVGSLDPTDGTVAVASGHRIAYFPQNMLQRLVTEFGDQSATQLLCDRLGLEPLQARLHLGGYGLKGGLAQQPIRTLSAGQRTRLHLAAEFGPGVAPPSLLVLDEVENLDQDTTDALLGSLSGFAGAVLCVTHDPAHLARFRPRQVWTVSAGSVSVQLTDHCAAEA